MWARHPIRFWDAGNCGMMASRQTPIVPLLKALLAVKQQRWLAIPYIVKNSLTWAARLLPLWTPMTHFMVTIALKGLKFSLSQCAVIPKMEFSFDEVHMSSVRLIWGSFDRTSLMTDWLSLNFSVMASDSAVYLTGQGTTAGLQSSEKVCKAGKSKMVKGSSSSTTRLGREALTAFQVIGPRYGCIFWGV